MHHGYSVYFNNNQAQGSGAAIANVVGTIGHVSRSHFYQGKTNLNGAAIFNFSGAIGPVHYNSFRENQAYAGGAIYSHIGSFHEFSNNTFSANSATSNGAAIYGWFASLTKIKNNTFYGNEGNALYHHHNSESGITLLANNLFVSNSHTDPGVSRDCFGPGFALVINGAGGNYSTETNSGCQGLVSSTVNPSLVGVFADNGCEVALPGGSCPPTHSLMNGSVAIDGSVLSPASVDQRGFVAVAQRDAGAYEYDASISDLIFADGFE